MIKEKAQKSTALISTKTGGKGGQEKLPSALHPVLDEMTKSFDKIDRLSRKTGRELVRAWYDVGKRVAEVRRDESKYGACDVTRLAEELSARRGRNVRVDDLNEARVVTEIYTWSDVEKLFARAEKANTQLAWSHFSRGLALLRKPKDAALRKKFEAQLIAEDLTVEQLCDMIRDHRKKTGAARSVRTRVSPKSAGAACRQIQKYHSEITKQLDGWDSSLFDWIGSEATPEELTDELLGELRETQSGVFALGKTVKEVGGKLEKAINRVEKVSACREERKEAGGKRKRKNVHEDEDVERDFDNIEVEDEDDDGIEVEVQSKGKKAGGGNQKH
jgi:hypothetical protein